MLPFSFTLLKKIDRATRITTGPQCITKLQARRIEVVLSYTLSFRIVELARVYNNTEAVVCNLP